MRLLRNNYIASCAELLLKPVGFVVPVVFVAMLAGCGEPVNSDLRAQGDGDFADDDVSTPANVSGSFMDFECNSIRGNVACLVRHNGYSVPLGDSRLMGDDAPRIVAYLTTDITKDSMAVFETEDKVYAESKIDDSNPWGFQVDFGDPTYVDTLQDFMTANVLSNPNMGLVLSIEESRYQPEAGSSARKYAKLNKCLLAYYLDEWANPTADATDFVTEPPTSTFTTYLGSGLLDLVYTEDCQKEVQATLKDGVEGSYMEAFSKELTDVMLDYFLTKGIDDDVFDEVVSTNDDAREL